MTPGSPGLPLSVRFCGSCLLSDAVSMPFHGRCSRRSRGREERGREQTRPRRQTCALQRTGGRREEGGGEKYALAAERTRQKRNAGLWPAFRRVKQCLSERTGFGKGDGGSALMSSDRTPSAVTMAGEHMDERS